MGGGRREGGGKEKHSGNTESEDITSIQTFVKFVTFCSWFHDPSTGGVSPKLLDKYVIVRRKHECHWDEICESKT